MRRTGIAVALSWALLGGVSPAAADPATYSDYEKESIDEALGRLGGEIDPAPNGKTITGIEIVTLDVLEDRDPVPKFFNIFHATTRRWVIESELLQRKGDHYDPRLAAEAARNLRKRRQLSLVLIVPLRGEHPDEVRLLVITKDVWSLRLNTDFQFYQGKLIRLLLQPAEENMFGTHKMVGALFILEPDTYSFGGQFVDSRVAGSRIQATVSANLIVNRVSGRPEGSFGTLYYGQPLYSADTKWAWKSAVVWYDEIYRSYIGTDLRTFDSDLTPGDDAIPYVFDAARWYSVDSVTRSFGREKKLDLSFGLEFDRRRNKVRDREAYDPVAVADFVRTEIPVSDRRVSPFLQIRSYTSDYHRVLDFETLGLQEDFRLGHEAVLRIYPASKDVMSTRDMIGTYAGLGYTLPFGDGLARLLGASVIEKSTRAETDASVQLNARVVTPRLGFGRFVYDGLLLNHYENYLNDRNTVGGDGRLRGYPPQSFIGKDVVASNVEYRSRPFQVWSVQVGGALFYDVADAFDGFRDLHLKQSTGVGFRAVFPQAERIVFRADWGVPILSDGLYFPGTFFASFGQAFGMPTLPAPSLGSSLSE